MNSYTATVIKTGNSYALRVPKQYAEAGKLSVGDKIDLPLPRHHQVQDIELIRRLFREAQALGIYRDIEDPVVWQRQERQDRPLPGRS